MQVQGQCIAGIAQQVQPPLMMAALSTGSSAHRSGGWQWTGLIISFAGVCIVIAGQYSNSGQSVGLVMYLLPLFSSRC